VRALEQCVLLEVERNDLRPLLENHPAIVEQLAQSISERRAALLKLTPDTKAKQGNDLLNTMLRLFIGT
jgi:CRP-like cAMP-binding protein